MALGDVTSLNITTLEAGVKAGNSFVYNCVPSVAKVRCTSSSGARKKELSFGLSEVSEHRECSMMNSSQQQ
jgi:hypothetical protein